MFLVSLPFYLGIIVVVFSEEMGISNLVHDSEITLELHFLFTLIREERLLTK